MTVNCGCPHRSSGFIKWVGFLLIVFFLLPMWSYPSSSQPGHQVFSQPGHRAGFEQLSLREGLSQSTVNAIIQDKKGFLWFATQDGLNRYDGYSFKIYRNNSEKPNSLSHNFIHALMLDRSGHIWIGTDAGGLDRFDPATEQFVNFRNDPKKKDSISQNRISVIFQDSNGTVWVGTERGGLNRMDDGSGTFTRFDAVPEAGAAGISNRINALCEDSHKRLWIGTRNGLYCLDFKTGPVSGLTIKPVSGNHILSVSKEKSGKLWVSTYKKNFYLFDPATRTIIKNYPFKWRVRKLLQDRSGLVWLGCADGGLSRFDPGTRFFTHYYHGSPYKGDFAGPDVNAIYQDQSGILWFGTNNIGINKLDPGKEVFTRYFHDAENKNSLSSPSIASIYEDTEGIVWLGTNLGILNRYDRKTGRYKFYVKGPGSTHISPIIADRSNRDILWIGSHQGFCRFDTKKESFQRFVHDPDNRNSLSENWVNAMVMDRDGTLWIGTAQGGMNRFERDTGKFKHYKHVPGDTGHVSPDNGHVSPDTGHVSPDTGHVSPDTGSLSHNFVFFIHRSRNGLRGGNGFLWIGTTRGLSRFNSNTGEFKSFFDDTGSRMLAICEDRHGVLWLGTMGGGLIKFEPQSQKVKRYAGKEGLLNNVVYGILDDRQGNLWLSTNKGIFKFDPVKELFFQFDKSDGLQDDEHNTFSAHKGRSGTFYFGGITGVSSFQPDQVKVNLFAPTPVITMFQAFNKEVDLNPVIWERRQLVLSYEDLMFSFQFSALEFSAPGKNRFAYKMEGFDREWLQADTGNRLATYTNLDPGNYTFKVKVTNNHGFSSAVPAALKIVITPPFWGTFWFKAALLVFVLLVLYVIFRFHIGSVRRRNEKLEILVNERTGDLQLKKDELEAANLEVKSVNEDLKNANERAGKERRAAELANSSKSDFLARMSHEIRTPMNSVIGFTDMLMETGMDEEQLDYVQTIHRSGGALLSLINDILDFSRVESGLLSLESIAFDPEDIAFDSCQLVRPRIGAKPVELLCRVDDNVPAKLKGDPGRFRQVLINLLGNAVKFTESGEVECALSIQKDSTDQVVLLCKVIDTGVGISTDKLDVIFECFQQGDGSITRKYGGSGLGLAICRQIARLMKGDIWVESMPGQGSIFYFTAVLDKVENLEKREKTIKEFAGKRVLVVDDNLHNIDILTHILESTGVEVKALTRGAEVVPAILADPKESMFDLCILDIQMPELSGYQVAGQIRQLQEPYSKLPLLAFSSSTAGRPKYKRFGFSSYLSKPVQRRKLIKEIGKLFQTGHREEEEKIPTPQVKEKKISPVVNEKKENLVLLAEDNPINSKLAGYLLAHAGYRFEMAANGKEALDLLFADPDSFSLILMDIQMPVMDGIEAVHLIRSKGYTEIPIIAMTAQSMKGDRERCIDAGMDDYISKPIKRDIFLDKVKQWMAPK